MSPRATVYDAIDCAIGKAEGASESYLAFARIGSAADFDDLLISNLAAPTAGGNRFSDIVFVCHPLKVICAIISRIMVYVAYIRQVIRISYPSDCYQSMNEMRYHFGLFGKFYSISSALPSTGGICRKFQDDASQTTLTIVADARSAAHPSKIRDLVKSFVSNDGAPFFSYMTGHVVYLLSLTTKEIAYMFGHVNMATEG